MASSHTNSSRPSGLSANPSQRSAPPQLPSTSTTIQSAIPQPPPSPHGFRAQLPTSCLAMRFSMLVCTSMNSPVCHSLTASSGYGGNSRMYTSHRGIVRGSRAPRNWPVKVHASRPCEHGAGKGGEDGEGHERSGTDTTAVGNGDKETKPMIPSVVVSESHPSGFHTSSATLFSSTSSSSSSTSSAPPASSSPTPSISCAPTPARGMTPYVPLREHSVHWSQTLSLTLRLPIDRNTSQLLPSPLKFVVQQRVIPDDPDAPRNPRLGAVRLDLAEYVDKGEVQRRYYSSRAARMPRSSNPPTYIAPPLAKAEILGGIAGLLSDSDINRTRPRMRDLDIYGPLEPFPTPPPPLTARQSIWSRAREEPEKEIAGVFDVRRLPDVYGPKTTETLIDALFNPVVTRDKAKAGPFTISSMTGSSSTGAERKDELEFAFWWWDAWVVEEDFKWIARTVEAVHPCAGVISRFHWVYFGACICV
ncbi:hypothetical protein BD779DRAFT_1470077 [Infundibulicybe gibba]|nr:hypothetical protein BD779DRAFT_1470077 [Infundibulicybe gibba]